MLLCIYAVVHACCCACMLLCMHAAVHACCCACMLLCMHAVVHASYCACMRLCTHAAVHACCLLYHMFKLRLFSLGRCGDWPSCRSPAFGRFSARPAVPTAPLAPALALCLLSAVRLPLVRCPLSAVRCPLSAVRCPLSSVLCPLSLPPATDVGATSVFGTQPLALSWIWSSAATKLCAPSLTCVYGAGPQSASILSVLGGLCVLDCARPLTRSALSGPCSGTHLFSGPGACGSLAISRSGCSRPSADYSGAR
jgi:hypothetical protein